MYSEIPSGILSDMIMTVFLTSALAFILAFFLAYFRVHVCAATSRACDEVGAVFGACLLWALGPLVPTHNRIQLAEGGEGEEEVAEEEELHLCQNLETRT